MEDIPGQEPKPVIVGDIHQLYIAHRLGLPIDKGSEVRVETDTEAMVVGSFGLRIDRESAERIETEAEPFDERMKKAREAIAGGDRASIEFLIGRELSDDEWQDLVRRNSGQTQIDDEPADPGFSLN